MGTNLYFHYLQPTFLLSVALCVTLRVLVISIPWSFSLKPIYSLLWSSFFLSKNVCLFSIHIPTHYYLWNFENFISLFHETHPKPHILFIFHCQYLVTMSIKILCTTTLKYTLLYNLYYVFFSLYFKICRS